MCRCSNIALLAHAEWPLYWRWFLHVVEASCILLEDASAFAPDLRILELISEEASSVASEVLRLNVYLSALKWGFPPWACQVSLSSSLDLPTAAHGSRKSIIACSKEA